MSLPNPYALGAAAIVLVAAAAGAVAVVHTYNTAIEERDAALEVVSEQSEVIEAQVKTLATLEAQKQALLDAQKTRQAVEVGIQREFEKRDAINRSYQNAPDTRDWYNTELPQRLRVLPQEARTGSSSTADVLRAPTFPRADREAPRPTGR